MISNAPEFISPKAVSCGKFKSSKMIKLAAAIKQVSRLAATIPAYPAFILLFLSSFLTPQKAAAQTYPVQLNVQLQPPFSGYLPDYTTPGSEQFKVFILFTDFTRPSYDIKLKFRLQGQGITIENPAYFYAGPFTVEPGVPLQLSGTDLAQLMAQQNLVYSGITTQQYNQRRVLPEGFYTLCVTAYDYLNPTPIQVSNEACTQAWMVISDPPLLNLPLCGSTVPEIQPQQITFSWTPLNMGGPSSALGTEYVLRLWEVRPAGNPAGNVILSSPPVDSIITTLTVANYTQLNYPLIDGMEYVWTVQARDAGGRELFRNRGMSAPCTFVWGNTFGASAASINLNLAAQVINHRQARLTWDSVSLFSSYRVEYRAQNYSPQWYPQTATDNATRLYDLTPQRTYEARVQGIMPNGQPGAWSDIVTFTTPAEAIIACGQTAPAPSMQNFKPLTTASIGMTWQIGQFEMLVTQLQSISNPQGFYSGLGKIKLFGLVGVACSFQNIRMNEELQMVAGEVHALTDGIDNWLAQANASGMIAPEISVNTVIDNPGDILVDTAAGTVTINGQTFSYTPDEGTAIEDANGSLWVVTANGTVVYAGQTGAVPLSLIHNYINTTTGTAVFGHTSESLYGFDAHQVPAWRLYYKDVSDKKDNSVKAVSWKSLQSEKYDEVSVQLTLSNGVNADSVFFFSHTGTRYQSHGIGNTRKFYVVGGNGNDRQEIYAGYYHSPDSLVNIGKVNAISFDKKEETLHLVPLTSGSTQAPSISAAQAAQLENALNAAYAGAVVKWTVKTDAALNAQNWDSDNDGKVKVGGTGLSRYSDEMKAINSRLKALPGYSRNDHYVFVTALQSDSSWTELEGVMPRGKNIGYVFLTPAQPGFNRTVQHELAHGAFALEHSFGGNAPAPKGSTDNLLDYTASGTKLVEWQWEWMHNPTGWNILDNEEDEASVIANAGMIWDFYHNPDSTMTFLSPAGLPLTLPKYTRTVTFSNGQSWSVSKKIIPLGVVTNFTLNDITYSVRADTATNIFSGYLGGTGYYNDTLSRKQSQSGLKAILGVPCYSDGIVGFRLTKTTYLQQLSYTIPQTNYLASGPRLAYDFLLNGAGGSMAIIGEIAGSDDFVEATFKPEYGDEAMFFLNTFSQKATCSTSDAYFTFTHATQINTYPEVYSNCASNFGWADPSTGLTPYGVSEIMNQNTAAVPVNLYGGFSFSMDATSNPAQQFIDNNTGNGLVSQVIAWNNSSSPVIYNQLNLAYNMMVSAVQTNNVSQLKAGMDAVTAMGACMCGALPEAQRKQGLQMLISDGEDKYILGYMTGLRPEQEAATLSWLEESNSALAMQLWSNMQGAELDAAVYLITTWMLTNRPATIESLTGKIPPQNSIGGNPPPSTHYLQVFDYGMDNWWLDPSTKMKHEFTINGHPYSNSGKFFVRTGLRVTVGQHDNNLNITPYSYFNDVTVYPLEYVLLDFASDCNFTDPISGTMYIKSGSRLVVPMLWAYWFFERFTDRQTEAKIRVMADVVAAALSLGQANVVLRGLELLFTVTDIAITINRNQIAINYGQQGNTFLAVWDNLFMTYGSLFILNGAARVVNTAAMLQTFRNLSTVAARENFVRLWVNFTEAIKNLPETTTAAMQQLGIGWRRVMQEVYNVQLSAGFVLQQPALASKVVARWVGEQVRAMVVTSMMEVGIANLEMAAGGGNYLMTNVRWMPATVQQLQVVGKLENVVYKDAQGVIRNGSVEIVYEPAGGQYFLRVDVSNILGTIVQNGNKIEYINPAGKVLKWSQQSANDITNSIIAAKNSTDIGRKLEGTVADFIRGEGKTVEGFSVKVNNENNQSITDIDIFTSNEIIEVKNSFNAWSSKPTQVNRFVNTSLDDFVNPHNKKAILYIETPLTETQKNIIIATIPVNVTLVNSLSELKLILK